MCASTDIRLPIMAPYQEGDNIAINRIAKCTPMKHWGNNDDDTIALQINEGSSRVTFAQTKSMAHKVKQNYNPRLGAGEPVPIETIIGKTAYFHIFIDGASKIGISMASGTAESDDNSTSGAVCVHSFNGIEISANGIYPGQNLACCRSQCRNDNNGVLL